MFNAHILLQSDMKLLWQFFYIKEQIWWDHSVVREQECNSKCSNVKTTKIRYIYKKRKKLSKKKAQTKQHNHE